MLAAHPQQEETADGAAEAQTPPMPAGVKNPFPAQMSVPGLDGEPVTVELAQVEGVLYAPRIDELPLAADVRQYVTQYCAAWSSSVLTADRFASQWPETPPRRAQIVFRESTLHAMLGLKGDERIMRFDVDQVKGELRVVVESPRLPPMPYWDGGPPLITLPVAAHYESQPGVQ